MSKNLKKSLSARISFYLATIFNRYPSILYLLKWFLITICIGACIGTASAGFLISLEWVTNFREEHIWLIAFLPIAGFVVGLLYYHYGRDIEGGNNLLIDTIHGKEEKIPFKMAPFVYLGTIITHFFGGSAGREGTALQMAGAIADQFTKVFQLSKEDRKTLIIAAVAAGFGSVFGTPLAGAIFALEFFFVRKLRYNALYPAFMAAIIADLVTRLWKATHTHYQIDFMPEISFQNIIFAIGAGVLFGLCAALFSKLMVLFSKQFKRHISYPPLRPFIGGVLVAIAVFALGSTRYIGLGIPSILESF